MAAACAAGGVIISVPFVSRYGYGALAIGALVGMIFFSQLRDSLN